MIVFWIILGLGIAFFLAQVGHGVEYYLTHKQDCNCKHTSGKEK